MQPNDLRQSAVECDRLAEESSDVFVRIYLTELAAEFRKQAHSLEDATPRPQNQH